MDEQFETFGQRLKKARKDKAYSQGELGSLIGVSATAIMRYEKNEREPKIEQVQNLAKALDISVSYLLGVQEANPFLDSAMSLGFKESTSPFELRAEQLRAENCNHTRSIMNQNEIDALISAAEQEHLRYLEALCFDLSILPEDYGERIRYVTSFIEKNADFLKAAMPGTHMHPDDVAEADRIRNQKSKK